MKNAIRFILVAIVVVFCASTVQATPTLFDWAFYVDGDTYLWGDTLPTYFDDSGFDWTTGLGDITITYDPGIVGSFSIISFFDHEFDADFNTWYNEYGSGSGTPAAGQSWEIDEPGYISGDIYGNTMAGSLDNSNAVPSGLEDDVSLAMGWDFSLTAGEQAVINLMFSTTEPTAGFYLSHTDPNGSYDDINTFFFSSTLDITGGNVPEPVPEPATMLLLGTGLVGLVSFRRRILK